jgi:hypothetical protein
MENDLRPGHHGKTNKLWIPPLVADDRRRRYIVDFEQGDGIARREKPAVERRQMTLGIAVRHSAATIEDDKTVVQLARAEYRRTYEDV